MRQLGDREGIDEVEEELNIGHASQPGSGAQQADRRHPHMMSYRASEKVTNFGLHTP